jgi:hypothetical protein
MLPPRHFQAAPAADVRRDRAAREESRVAALELVQRLIRRKRRRRRIGCAGGRGCECRGRPERARESRYRSSRSDGAEHGPARKFRSAFVS